MIDTAAIWTCPVCTGVYRVGYSARRHRKYERDKANPQRAARRRARARVNQRRYLERHADRQRDATRRWRAAVQADPERRSAYNADQRINYRLRADGPVRGARVEDGYKGPGSACDKAFDSAPLIAWLEQTFAGDWGRKEIAKACRVNERTLYQLLTVREPLVSLHVADCVLTGYGRPDLLNALYPVES